MWCDWFRNLANTVSLLELTLNCAFRDVLAWHLAWKEPVLWLFHSTHFNRGHDTPLGSRERPIMLLVRLAFSVLR